MWGAGAAAGVIVLLLRDDGIAERRFLLERADKLQLQLCSCPERRGAPGRFVRCEDVKMKMCVRMKCVASQTTTDPTLSETALQHSQSSRRDHAAMPWQSLCSRKEGVRIQDHQQCQCAPFGLDVLYM